MTVSLFLQTIIDRMEDAIERVQLLSVDLTDQQLNWEPDDRHWSMGQIFDHMLIATDFYVPHMREATSEKLRSPADPEVLHTWFGKIVIKGAGPSGKGPVPKQFVPKSPSYRREIVDRWVARHREIMELARQARGLDISDISLRNPLMSIFKMNLADFFEVLAAHAERHVGQIERLQRSVPKAAAIGSTELLSPPGERPVNRA